MRNTSKREKAETERHGSSLPSAPSHRSSVGARAASVVQRGEQRKSAAKAKAAKAPRSSRSSARSSAPPGRLRMPLILRGTSSEPCSREAPSCRARTAEIDAKMKQQRTAALQMSFRSCDKKSLLPRFGDKSCGPRKGQAQHRGPLLCRPAV